MLKPCNVTLSYFGILCLRSKVPYIIVSCLHWGNNENNNAIAGLLPLFFGIPSCMVCCALTYFPS